MNPKPIKQTHHSRHWLIKHGYVMVGRNVGEFTRNYSPLPHVGYEVWEGNGETLERYLSREMMKREWWDFETIAYLAPRKYKSDELREVLNSRKGYGRHHY